MKRILRLIQEEKARFDDSPFLRYLRDRSVDPRVRLSYGPCIAPWVMGFADLNRFVLRDDSSSDPIQRIINAHTRVDDQHYRMFLRDLDVLTPASGLTLGGAMAQLWSEDTEQSRNAVYRLIALSAPATPVMRLVIIECTEAAGNAGFQTLAQAAEELRRATGQRLSYFGDAHLELEGGHAMGTDNVEEVLARIELSAPQLEEARALVLQVFELFHAMAEEHRRYVQKVNPA